MIEVEEGVELSDRNADHLLLHGTLSKQKKFIQNQNIKICRNPLESESDVYSSEESLTNF